MSNAPATAAVFVVTAWRCDYDCRQSKVVGTFASRVDAELAVKQIRDAIAHRHGKQEAIYAMMKAWEASHPCPENDEGAWYEAQRSEQDRLEKAVGVPMYHDWGGEGASVEEVCATGAVDAFKAWEAWDSR